MNRVETETHKWTHGYHVNENLKYVLMLSVDTKESHSLRGHLECRRRASSDGGNGSLPVRQLGVAPFCRAHE